MSGNNQMSEDYVRTLDPNGLCQWLRDRGALSDDFLQDARNVIVPNKINGAVFLNLTVEKWRKDVDLAYGVACLLVELAEKVKKSGTQEEDQRNPDAVSLANARQNLSVLISALTRIVEGVLLPVSLLGRVAFSLDRFAKRVSGTGFKRVSELFPEDYYRVKKKSRHTKNDGDEMDDPPGESKADGNDSFDVIEMRDLPPMVDKNDKHKRVYVRRCYIALFDELVELIGESRFNAMITGNPGIGKSYFYLYVIFRFIKDRSLLGKWTLVINSGENFHILKGNVFESIHPEKIRLDGNILRLVDGETSRGELTGWDGTTILFASPSNSSEGNKPTRLMKSYGSNYFYMPVWDDEELIRANNLLDPPLKQTELELFEKVKLAGPIPRFVLFKDITVESLRDDIKGQLGVDNMLDILKFVEGRNGVREDHYSHRLLKMCPKKAHRTGRAGFTLDFLSTEISRMVLDGAREDVVANFKKFALENNDSDSAKFRGNIYEHLIHRHFKNPTLEKISGKCLESGDTFEIVLPKKIQMGQAFQKIEDVEVVLGQPLYAIPASKRQGAYDSFLWNGTNTCYIFQITIAETHSILNHCVKECLAGMKKFNISNLVVKFVFIVPSKMIEKWNRSQQLVTTSGSACKREGSKVSIDQYVVALDL